jgi:hypothetical protein
MRLGLLRARWGASETRSLREVAESGREERGASSPENEKKNEDRRGRGELGDLGGGRHAGFGGAAAACWCGLDHFCTVTEAELLLNY